MPTTSICVFARMAQIGSKRGRGMAKIKPYQKAVYLDEETAEFTRSYPKDTMVFSETMPGRQLYIIQQGQVKITKIMNNNEVLLAVLKPGDIFGEMSLLENKPRSASAISFEDSVLLAVNRENFRDHGSESTADHQ